MALQIPGFDGEIKGFDPNSIFWLFIFYVLPLLIIFKVPLFLMNYNAKKFIESLQKDRDFAKAELIKELKSQGFENNGQRIDEMLEYFTINPVDLDPKGIVNKIDYLHSLQGQRMRQEIERFVPGAKKAERQNIESLLEIAATINVLFKVVRHLYLTAKKSKSIIWAMQTLMLKPFIEEIIEALKAAIPAIKRGNPIGDSIGPMVVAGFMKERIPVALDTVYSVGKGGGDRKLIFVKAEGPGQYGGKNWRRGGKIGRRVQPAYYCYD